MVDVFHGVAFPVRAAPRRPQGLRDVAPDAPPPVDMGPWTRTSDARPTDAPGGQVDVLFGSRDWAWAIVGLYTNWPDDEVAKGAVRWEMYDQVNDRYVECFKPGEDEPEFWMLKPELPKPGDTPSPRDTDQGDATMPTSDADRPAMSGEEIHAAVVGRFAETRDELAALRSEVERLRDENHELRATPWPAWADAILRKLRSYGIDPDDEVHLAAEFDGYMDEFEQEIRRQCARVGAPDPGKSFELDDGETEDLERVLASVSEDMERTPKAKRNPDEKAMILRLARLRGRLAAFDERTRTAVPAAPGTDGTPAR